MIDARKMSEENMDLFYRIAAKLWYVSKQTRVDIDLVILYFVYKGIMQHKTRLREVEEVVTLLT